MTTDLMTYQRELPPYGPAKGMLEGLQLMTRLAPTRVDERLLRQHGVAPRNEYKVVGALRYLGLIDYEGRPTEASRLLKTRGPVFIEGIRTITRRSYPQIFERYDLEHATRDDLYNHFVTEHQMGGEMATKALRFFLDLCKLGDMPMNPGLEARRGRRPGSRNRATIERLQAIEEGIAAPPSRGGRRARTEAAGLTVSLALTPEMMLMDEDRLTEFFSRVRRALSRAFDTPTP